MRHDDHDDDDDDDDDDGDDGDDDGDDNGDDDSDDDQGDINFLAASGHHFPKISASHGVFIFFATKNVFFNFLIQKGV